MDRVSAKGYRAMLAQAVGEEAAGGVNSAIKTILRHRGGTNGEDLYAIDLSTGRTVTSCVTSKAASMVSPGRPFRKKLEDAVEGGAMVALLHNHPASSMPSASDLENLVENGCELGARRNRVPQRNCGKKLDRSNRSERRLHCIQTRIRCST